jgi:hypothetical protein
MSSITGTMNASPSIPSSNVTIDQNKPADVLKKEGKQELGQAEGGKDKLIDGAGDVAGAAIDATKTGASGVAGAFKSVRDGAANKASWAGEKLSNVPSTIGSLTHKARLRVAAPVGTETLSAKTTLGLGALLGTLAGIAKYSSVEVLIHASHLAAGSAMLLGLYLLYKLIDRARHGLPESIDASRTSVTSVQALRRVEHASAQVKSAMKLADAEAVRLNAAANAKLEEAKKIGDDAAQAKNVSQKVAAAKVETDALRSGTEAPKVTTEMHDAPDQGHVVNDSTNAQAPTTQAGVDATTDHQAEINRAA